MIKKGADVNEMDQFGRTALMIASWCGNTELVKKLIESGANIEAMDANGMSAIWYVFMGSKDEKIMQYLLEHGARLYKMDRYGSKVAIEDNVQQQEKNSVLLHKKQNFIPKVEEKSFAMGCEK